MVSMAWMGLAGFAVSAFGLLLQAAADDDGEEK
jgi:hypothetical protein